jgi:hypothetical protein
LRYFGHKITPQTRKTLYRIVQIPLGGDRITHHQVEACAKQSTINPDVTRSKASLKCIQGIVRFSCPLRVTRCYGLFQPTERATTLRWPEQRKTEECGLIN